MTDTKRAVILAGGKGRRLAPYTFVIPKPIVPIGTTPILEIVLRQLARFGFGHVSIALGHMSEIVRAVAGDGSRFGIEIDYHDEEQPLGTMGPLKGIANLPSTFLVMNADILTDLDFRVLWDDHRRRGGIATIGTFVKETQLGLGVLHTDSDDRVVGFEEKPILRHRVSMGIYVFEREILDYIPAGDYFGFDLLMARLLERKCSVHSFVHAGRWLDIGNPADYEKAQEEYETSRANYLADDVGR